MTPDISAEARVRAAFEAVERAVSAVLNRAAQPGSHGYGAGLDAGAREVGNAALKELRELALIFSAEQNTGLRLATISEAAPVSGGEMPGREAIADIINTHVSGPSIALGMADPASHRLDQLAAADAILSLAATGGTGAEAMREAAAKVADAERQNAEAISAIAETGREEYLATGSANAARRIATAIRALPTTLGEQP